MLRAVQPGDTLQKTLGIFMLRMIEDLVTGTGLHDTTGIHDCNTVTHARHDTQVMGDHDDGHAQLVLQLHHQLKDLRLNRNVQCGSRLIGDQKLRLQERLVLAGPIPETGFGKEMLHKIDADPRVIRTGLVQGQELAELFSNCRLFVLPSHTEGLSLALLEAMSCGGRCLVSDIPANTVITKQYGAEFEAENIDSLAAALSKELTTPKDEVLLKQEIEYVKENFDYDAVIEWHEDVYKCALNRKNEKRWEQNC